ncbi:indole-3-glycerol phosphate synthase [Salinibacter sp. 10B]|uniref:indole-3-glycerol phosphate synthase TrpC n=1 Tax=Salinibacter sp. 10B TaxID=1923971 RepID=UPI000D2E5E82|nr:indole-3-glycerol phosphate synthase TrpC [Salinibacter sp. 10B]PQJ34186.1 indole-3-glycerol phosphate synthase [Salinibacter sp. 10B]
MSNVLDKIIADTRELVAKRKKETPIAELKDRPFYDEREPLSLVEALQESGMSFIAEVKKASPSKGVIREDFDPARIAQQYAANDTSAISVLTEPLHFQGSLEHLAWIRAHVPDVPLLRKDFIVDPYQLVEARAVGADAVLLIATALAPGQLSELHAAATELGLSCLVEVYSREDLEKIDWEQVSILGVNNRDLTSFEVDIENSLRIFENVPRSVGRVAESGLSDPETLVRLREAGVNGVLIGEHFMRADHPGEAVTDLRNRAKQIALERAG